MNSDEHVIDVCIQKIQSRLAAVWVYLKLSDGNTYKIPYTEMKKILIASEDMYASSGLRIRYLNPLRKWHISFNGLLEKCNSDAKNELVHAKFSFIWLAMSRLHEQNKSYSGKELTDAFIRENRYPRGKHLKGLYEHLDRYEQWGQMMGTIKLNEENEKECYFWSMKTRITESPLQDVGLISTKFYMYLMDGQPLKLESLSVKGLLSNLTSGYSLTPSGCINPISRCDFNVDSFEENDRRTSFSYVTSGKNRKINIEFTGEDATLHVESSPNIVDAMSQRSQPTILDCKVKIRPFRVQTDDSEGFGVLHHLVSPNIEEKKTGNIPPILHVPDSAYDYRTVRPIGDCGLSKRVGGKGRGLALLTEIAKNTKEFLVPKGIIIDGKEFQDTIGLEPGLYMAISRVLDVSRGEKDGDLKTVCDECRKEYLSTELDEDLKDSVEEALVTLGLDVLNDKMFSVRSSAVGEDGLELSAAGQMKTVLGVKGMDNICKGILECWASKFSFEAVQYSRQNGLPLKSPMAVVIQEMIPSDISGVLFTVDPVSGNPMYPCITANFGLGETVVSSTADPDVITLRREMDQIVDVSEIKVGSKMKQVFVKREGGTEQKNCKNKSNELCLTKEWAMKIGRVGISIESCLGYPCDIEWAVYKDQLYILQARPITTLHKETDFELRRDQDTPVRYMNDTWTTANVGEVFPGALSPLAISLVATSMDIYGHIDQVIREGKLHEFNPYYFHLMPVMQRHIALNLTDVLLKENEKQITPVQRAIEIAMFGRGVITDEIHQAAIKKYGYASTKQNLLIVYLIVKLIYTLPKKIEKLEQEMKKYKLPLETYTSPAVTWSGIVDQMVLFSQVRYVHGMTTFLSSIYNMTLMLNLKKSSKEWDAELFSNVANLLSNSGVESVDVPGSLQNLARIIADIHGEEFSSLSTKDAYDMLKNDTGYSKKLFEDFIEKHGHRCAKEFDIYSKSWRMDSTSLMQILQNMVKTPGILECKSKEISNSEALSNALLNDQTWLVNFLLPRCRNYVCLREKTKSMLIKNIDWLRISCYHLGALMVRNDMLPDANHVFFLTADELISILQKKQRGIVHKAARRKFLHKELNELKFPEIIKGIPKPISEQQEYSSGGAASFTLKGTPVCQGVVKGRAIVVLTLEDASQIKRGDILITHATDIGWSPYFPFLSGVVTVLGGLISHGAVVAREFGLPCVVAVENATTAFKTGDIVMLNGIEGTVMKVSE